MVSDSISGSLAVLLMVSLPVLLALSLGLCLHLAESSAVVLVGPLVVYQLFFHHVSGWLSGYVYLFLWPCTVFSISPKCV